jgi:hypothetical protein
MISRRDRLVEFMRRLAALTPSCCADCAFETIRDTLNSVEDELSGVPYNPCHPRHDGRLYPAKPNARCRTPGRPDLRRYRFRAHRLYIAASGAILIAHRELGPIFSKPGDDGALIVL